MNTADRVTLLVAAMLTGQTAPSDSMVDQAILIATVAARKIEEEHARH